MHPMKIEPYWWEEAPPRDLPEHKVERTCDVAIVGGGYTGLNAALELARAGRSVQVFDKEQPGFGCSTRNGGIVSGTTKFKLAELFPSVGERKAKALFQEGIDAENWLEDFIAREKIDCSYQRSGRFIGAYRPAHYEALAREVEMVNRHFQRDLVVVPKAEQHAEIGSDHYHGGSANNDVAGLHPGRYHAGLLERVLEAGVTVHGRTCVLGFNRDGDGIAVETARGPVAARDLVVATNGYTDEHLPWLRRRLVPVASQIIVTEPLPRQTMDRLMPKKRMLVDTRVMFHYYRPSPDHTRIVFGGRAGAWSDDPTVKAEALRRNLVTIFPEVATTRLSHVWWGYVAFPFDFRPKLAHVDGVHYATGFCGTGVVWASWFGRLAARRILAEEAVATELGSDPFESRPLYNGWPWFLPFMIGWYRVRDML
jgi:glycine/D-amino acid oxidase-like deaminating enzyme